MKKRSNVVSLSDHKNMAEALGMLYGRRVTDGLPKAQDADSHGKSGTEGAGPLDKNTAPSAGTHRKTEQRGKADARPDPQPDPDGDVRRGK